ncbi:MAG TPA: lipopolysaccharide heptosyltransferase II [Bacteroidetes bacterium]|nr:lipopolysaccharide heptosyltransferase II [Bacteroidota bacterium]
MLPEWKKILIVKLRAIGDVILTTPVFRNLREQFPDAQIDFVVEKPAYPLIQTDKNLNRVFIAPSGKNRTVSRERKFFKEIRREKYDVCIDLFGNPRSALITLFSGAKLRVGYYFRGRKYAYQEKFSSRVSEVHEVEFNLDALRHFNIPIRFKQPEIHINEVDLAAAHSIFEKLYTDDFPVAALNPAGSWPAKKWPLPRFAQLAKMLHEEFHFRFVVLWGPGELAEAQLLAEKIGPVAAVHPETTLSQQAALLALCQLFIGNDTGPMHIAAAVGISTIGLYGPTNARLQSPYGEKARAVFNPDIPCLGCDCLTCPLMDCMNYLTPETVFAAAKDLLEENRRLN